MAGHHAASIGTLGVTTADDQVTTGLTTPDIVTFLSNMAGLAREGVTHAAFEASSHGLSQYRTEGLPVTAAAFTNFSRDHLDYHQTMEAYFEAKMRLFTDVLEPGAAAVIWADDPKSGEVAERCRARGLRVITVGTKGETIRLVAREPSQLGQKLTIEADGSTRQITIPLIGAYQAANTLTAAALVWATGGELALTLANLARVQPVRGRLERAVITRAGAPSMSTMPIRRMRSKARSRRFGRTRRAASSACSAPAATATRASARRMGAVAARMSDLVIVTDDNPRSEIRPRSGATSWRGAGGARGRGRRKPSPAAIAEAGADDIILLAGKGHEQGQMVGDRVPFDDVKSRGGARRELVDRREIADATTARWSTFRKGSLRLRRSGGDLFIAMKGATGRPRSSTAPFVPGAAGCDRHRRSGPPQVPVCGHTKR
jgi:UDP-N-acetylmuramoyl-L-alanyl-D-glutamate--2,6-diaminopimelate ligase